ncbi:MAG: hypothetical protein PHQ39_09765 [Methanothrix soehngenii]|jgi:hypothetical protein|nr:hypothetical protein [Methanothrix soehngenii]
MLSSSSIVILDTLLSLHALTIFDFKEFSKCAKGVATNGNPGLITLSVAQNVNLLTGKQRKLGLRGKR